MSDNITDVVTSTPTTLGGTILGTLLGAAWLIPKLINNFKSDVNTGSLIERVSALEERSQKQDNKIHNQQIRITRLVALYIKLEAHLDGKNIPQEIMDELAELISDPDDADLGKGK